MLKFFNEILVENKYSYNLNASMHCTYPILTYGFSQLWFVCLSKSFKRDSYLYIKKIENGDIFQNQNSEKSTREAKNHGLEINITHITMRRIMQIT